MVICGKNAVSVPTFRGVNQVSVDAKGRMAMPSRYRQLLHGHCDGQLVITADCDGCLLVYPLPQWPEIESQLMKLPNFSKQVRFLQRIVLGYATECAMDAHGRFLLPPPLREFAHIGKQAALIGQGAKFELWDYQSWSKQRDIWMKEESDTKDVHEVLEKVRL